MLHNNVRVTSLSLFHSDIPYTSCVRRIYRMVGNCQGYFVKNLEKAPEVIFVVVVRLATPTDIPYGLHACAK